MAFSGKNRERRKRRGEVAIFAASLLLAFVIWVAHNLTQDYFSYRQYKITVVTSLPGFASESESEEILVAGGDAKGYDIIGRRSHRARNAESVTIEVDPKYFTQDMYRSDLFTVKARDIQETLNQKVGTEFNITYVPDQKLSFVFSRQSNRKVPVVLSETRISCRPQYMTVSDVALEPDSVLVYGNEEDLARIREVHTYPLRLQNLSKPTKGELLLREVPGMRLGSKTVGYSIGVERYVEQTVETDVTAVNVPAGKRLLIIPSRIKAICRLPFKNDGSLTRDDIRFEVDYNTVVSSAGAQAIPQLVATKAKIYSCDTDPKVVECIIADYTGEN